MVFSTKEMLKNQQTIISLLQEIKETMGTTNTQAQLGFADVQQAITQLVNDNTASNNAIAAQIQEIQGLLLDFSNKPGGPSQADLQTAIAQLQAVHSAVTTNTAQVQATTTAIQQADPSALQSAQGASSSQGQAPGSTQTGSGASAGGTGSTSGASNTPPETPNPSGQGGATTTENTSSGLG
jgi:hypothetical protein